MNNPRIVFIGTPEFAVASLKKLVENKYNVVGVVTVWDKPSGRGRKLRPSPIKEYAVSQNIAVLEPKNLKNETFLNELKSLKADLQIVVAFRMLPKSVWDMPKLGTFNLHTSLLPEYRGSAPINWAIINGETETGVTTFFLNEKIDTGEIILNRKVEIKPEQTFGELHDVMMEVGANLVLETVDLIKTGNITTTKQPEKELKQAPKLFPENSNIDWNKSVKEIYNFVRGLNPYPIAKTTFKIGNENYEVQVFKVNIQEEVHNHNIKSVFISKKEIKIAVKDGFVTIEELKFPGKKKMDVKSFLNGFTFEGETSVYNPYKA